MAELGLVVHAGWMTVPAKLLATLSVLLMLAAAGFVCAAGAFAVSEFETRPRRPPSGEEFVFGPDGERGYLPAADVSRAISTGFRRGGAMDATAYESGKMKQRNLETLGLSAALLGLAALIEIARRWILWIARKDEPSSEASSVARARSF